MTCEHASEYRRFSARLELFERISAFRRDAPTGLGGLCARTRLDARELRSILSGARLSVRQAILLGEAFEIDPQRLLREQVEGDLDDLFDLLGENRPASRPAR